jgi:hypothetical protein
MKYRAKDTYSFFGVLQYGQRSVWGWDDRSLCVAAVKYRARGMIAKSLALPPTLSVATGQPWAAQQFGWRNKVPPIVKSEKRRKSAIFFKVYALTKPAFVQILCIQYWINIPRALDVKQK